MYKLISVPDAIKDDTTISFRMVFVKQMVNHLFPVKDREGPVKPPQFPEEALVRNFNQISWLHKTISTKYPTFLIPPLPDSPDNQLLSSTDYLSRKRLQIERYLNRLLYRKEVFGNQDVLLFISGGGGQLLQNSMSKIFPNLGLGFGLMDHIIKSNYDRGFRIYRPAVDMAENDAKSFAGQQNYVLSMEDKYAKVIETILDSFTIKEDLARDHEVMSDTFGEMEKSTNLLGDGKFIDNSRKLVLFENGMRTFITYCKSIDSNIKKRIKYENCFFADVMAEYKGMTASLKKIMNYKTDSLIAYIDSIKNESGKKLKMDQTAKSGSAAGKAISTADHTTASKKRVECYDTFVLAQKSLTKEFVRFERLKVADMKESLNHLIQIQVETESSILKDMESALSSILVSTSPNASPNTLQ